MPQRPERLPELVELVSALCDDAITDEQFARLDGLLASDPAARLYYAVALDMHVELSRRWGEPELTARPAAGRHVPLPRVKQRRWLAWSIAAAAATVVGIVAWMFQGNRGHREGAENIPAAQFAQQADEVEPTTNSVAVLTRAANLVWTDAADRRAVGTPLSPGWLRIKSGALAVQFFTGASVILEGPAELQIIDAKQAFCRSGRLSAEVPPHARGFRIGTPQLAVLDLGTAFGLNVKEGYAEVHVLKGEVALKDYSKELPNLKEGAALAVRREGVRPFRAERSDFISAEELEHRSAESLRRQYDRWRAASGVNADPALLVRFDFQEWQRDTGCLMNVARNKVVAPGTTVGGGAVEGRWPGKTAMEFHSLSERVCLNIPGRYDSLTLVTWVRVEGLACAYNSLFMCEGYSAGGFHWQIDRKGVLDLGVRGPDEAKTSYGSPVIFTPERIGQWVCLAWSSTQPRTR